jgi:DNA polymerase III subunit epsilon
MAINLTRPLAFFDLETTGLNITKDRIVEMHILKVNPDQSIEEKTYLLNPTIPISPEAAAVHGISNEDVKDCPTFADKASDILAFFDNCDLAGFNSNRFDIPLISEEFFRVGLDFKINDRKTIDIQNIFHKKEKRNLEAAYQFYCDKTLINAHSASADTFATYEILLSQIERYDDIENNIDFLAAFTTDSDIVDTGRRLIKIKEVICINFGKHKGVPVTEVFTKDPGYYSWIMNNDFATDTKNKIKEIKMSMK